MAPRTCDILRRTARYPIGIYLASALNEIIISFANTLWAVFPSAGEHPSCEIQQQAPSVLVDQRVALRQRMTPSDDTVQTEINLQAKQTRHFRRHVLCTDTINSPNKPQT